MKRFLTAAVAVLFLILAPAGAAHAGGSDAPTPYTLTTVGIQLPEGDTFPAGGHVNARWFDTDGYEQSGGIHFEGNGQPGEPYIGASFLPWHALGIEDGSQVIWVQIHGYNQHWGEGGQKPVPVGPQPDPNSETRHYKDTEHTSVPQCPTDEAGYGVVVETVTEWKIYEERASVFEWDSDTLGWVEVWGEWVETDRTELSSTSQTRQMTDAEYADCGLPPTGAPLIGAALGALALIGTGGALAIRNRRN